MKKIFTLIAGLIFSTLYLEAQNDTLLYENFDVDPTAAYALFNSGNDLTWVDMDLDANPDANARPNNWFWNQGAFATTDTTGCLFSSSWFTTPLQCNNWLMTPPIQIVDANAVLHWTAAPRQTPLYVDGYKVLVSTTDNFEMSFTDTIFVAAEYLSGSSANGFNFSAYTFSPGFVHGEDSTYVEFDGDSSRFVGVLRPFSASLAAYSGQTIYIAFLHDAFDDNLIAVDDILVTGTQSVGLPSLHNDNQFSLLPNPASDMMELKLTLPVASPLIIKMYDMKGALVNEINYGTRLAGQHSFRINVSALENGSYTMEMIAGNKMMQSRFVVSR